MPGLFFKEFVPMKAVGLEIDFAASFWLIKIEECCRLIKRYIYNLYLINFPQLHASYFEKNSQQAGIDTH